MANLTRKQRILQAAAETREVLAMIEAGGKSEQDDDAEDNEYHGDFLKAVYG